MRVLCDENVPAVVVRRLREAQMEVAWVLEDRPGISDEEVLAWAGGEERVLLTFDKDFGELVYHRERTALHGVVLVRVLLPPEELAAFIVAQLASRDDWDRHFAVIDESSMRIRALPGRG